MTPQEIELEIQKRVEFKMNEFKTALKNRVKIKWHIAANELTHRSQYIWQAFEEIEGMIQKEILMPLPILDNDTMLQHSKRNAKNKAVDEMMEYLNDFRGRSSLPLNVNRIVDIIEKAQNYL